MDGDNYKSVIALQVHPHQSAWVASNMYSLAEAYVFSVYQPLALYEGGDLVGFAMLCRHVEGDTLGEFFAGHFRPEYWISRFMIGQQYQGRGLGRDALNAIVARMSAAPDCHEVNLGVAADNAQAIALYRNFGFEIGDRLPWGELHGRLRLEGT